MAKENSFSATVRGSMPITAANGYVVLAATDVGQIGVDAFLPGGGFGWRVEPFSQEGETLLAAELADGWEHSRNDDPHHFLTVSTTFELTALTRALQALLKPGASPQFFPSTPACVKALAAEIQAQIAA